MVRTALPFAPLATDFGVPSSARLGVMFGPSGTIDATDTVVLPALALAGLEASARIPPPGVRLTRPTDAAVNAWNCEVRLALESPGAAGALLGWKRNRKPFPLNVLSSFPLVLYRP